MKIHPKSVVLGSLIALLIMVPISIAAWQLKVRVNLYIPPGTDIWVQEGHSGTPNKPGGITLNYTLDAEHVTLPIKLYNRGSKDCKLTWLASGVPDNVNITVKCDTREGRARVSTWKVWSGYIVIPRGTCMEVTIMLTDCGAEPGNYGFSMVFVEG